MNRSPYPILEHDPDPSAVIEPHIGAESFSAPERCVPCFFHDVVTRFGESDKAETIGHLESEMGRQPIYAAEFFGERIAFFQPGVGAPLAAGYMEEMIARGGRKFIACGGAGVLNREIAVGHVIVPSAAVRDEGTSYHYLPPAREAEASPEGIAAIEAVLSKRRAPYLVGKTWTTDAFFRETRARVRRRREEGCLTVEMEAAALFAVARFRGVLCAQLLYGGDDVSGDAWDSRDWNRRESVRETLFLAACEACASL